MSLEPTNFQVGYFFLTINASNVAPIQIGNPLLYLTHHTTTILPHWNLSPFTNRIMASVFPSRLWNLSNLNMFEEWWCYLQFVEKV